MHIVEIRFRANPLRAAVFVGIIAIGARHKHLLQTEHAAPMRCQGDEIQRRKARVRHHEQLCLHGCGINGCRGELTPAASKHTSPDSSISARSNRLCLQARCPDRPGTTAVMNRQSVRFRHSSARFRSPGVATKQRSSVDITPPLQPFGASSQTSYRLLPRLPVAFRFQMGLRRCTIWAVGSIRRMIASAALYASGDSSSVPSQALGL